MNGNTQQLPVEDRTGQEPLKKQRKLQYKKCSEISLLRLGFYVTILAASLRFTVLSADFG